MPASLSASLNINLKSLKLTALFLLFPLFFFAQSLTGLWTGALSNDSNTVRKDQSFEIVLTGYRGKVYGYSRSEFIVNDTLYYILKRVKGTIESNVCEVKDDEIISYNFPTRLDKGIKVTSTFYRNKNDNTWYLAGTWKTNQTKNYYAVTGKVDLQEEKDLNTSKIFPHLEELKLADDVAFYKDWKPVPSVVKIAKPEKRTEPLSTHNDVVATPDQPIIQKATPITVPVVSTPVIAATSNSKKPEVIASSTVTSVEIVKAESPKKLPVISSTKPDTKNIAPTTQISSESKQPETIVAVPNKNNTIALTNPPAEKKEARPPARMTRSDGDDLVGRVKTEPVTVTPEIKKTVPDIPFKAALIAGRRSEFSQVVNFKSDSLELSLYDNGEIDGDTVSIFLNGEKILARQGLKASAIKKTIYITPGNEEFTLVMFAENLGKYPPNTGLLVVHDGEDVYNLRFSSDFQKNAGIVFRKKK